MINDIWNFITANPNAFKLLDNKYKVKGSKYGYLYEIIGGDKFILGLGEDMRPNYMLFIKGEKNE